LYSSFRVYGSKIQVEFSPQTPIDTIECTITPSESVGSPANVSVAMAQPLTKSAFFNVYRDEGTGRSKNVLTNSCTQHKLLGVTKSAIENDLSGNYEGSALANPIKLQYWIINIATPSQVILTQPIEYRVSMTYHVELWSDNSGNLVQ